MTDIAGAEPQTAEVPGQLDDGQEDLVKEITDNLRRGRNHWAKWRERAREDYDFFASNQWSEEDKQKLDKEKRPAVVFNRVARTINAVAGLELQNRQEIRYIPRQVDPQVAGYSENLTNAGKWVKEQCDAEDEESESFQDGLICGVGWVETHMDYEQEADGKVIEERIDPLEMMADPDSVKRNFADAKWVAHIRQISKKELREMFPNYEDATPGTFWNDVESDPHDATRAPFYENDQSDKLSKPNTYTLTKYQYWVRQPYYKVVSPDGNMVELDAEKFAKLQGIIQTNGLQSVKLIRRVYKQCFLIGNKILEQTDLGCDHYTFQAITGLRDRNSNYWFGLVHLMKDPQRWANKWLSQIQHIVNTSAKNGLYAEIGAFVNKRKAEEEHAVAGSITELNDGGLAKIKPKEPAQYPDGVDRLLTYAIQAINDVPGVNLELMGMADRDQPIGLEESRKKAGITILANFFDSLRRFRKQQGRVLAYFIREYISDGRLIRVLGQEGAQYIPLLRDQLAFQYDVVVDDAPNSPNVKERVFGALLQMIPMALQAQIPIPPDILDYAPLPETLIMKWKGMLNDPQKDQMHQELQQIQQIMHYLEIMKQQKDLAKTDSEILLNNAKASQAGAVGDNQELLAIQKATQDSEAHFMNMNQIQADNQRKDFEAQTGQARKNLEMLLNQRRKMIETKMNTAIKAHQANNRAVQ